SFARRQWSSTGIRKDSVLPEPVPVVTSVGRGRCPSLLVSRANASAWWAYGGGKSAGYQSRWRCQPSSAVRKGRRIRKYGPRNSPSAGSVRKSSSASWVSGSASANVVVRYSTVVSRSVCAARVGLMTRCGPRLPSRPVIRIDHGPPYEEGRTPPPGSLISGARRSASLVVGPQAERGVPGQGAHHAEVAAIQREDRVRAVLGRHHHVHRVRETDLRIPAHGDKRRRQMWLDLRDRVPAYGGLVPDVPQSRLRRLGPDPGTQQVVEFGQNQRAHHQVGGVRDGLAAGRVLGSI